MEYELFYDKETPNKFRWTAFFERVQFAVYIRKGEFDALIPKSERSTNHILS